ncbi:MAG: hypothetical protein L0323_02325 [Planctomycetes bacterium]|nr:hypothetical protein [Planctomycetota bacterium]
MERLDRSRWSRREKAFALFHEWEDAFRSRASAEDRAREIRFALEAADLWRASLPAGMRESRVDLEKVRGIVRMRETLARVRFRG